MGRAVSVGSGAMSPIPEPPNVTYMCVTGAPADEDGVCTEHGETACVIGIPGPACG